MVRLPTPPLPLPPWDALLKKTYVDVVGIEAPDVAAADGPEAHQFHDASHTQKQVFLLLCSCALLAMVPL